MPKHVGVKNLEPINKKIRYFLEHFLVFLQTQSCQVGNRYQMADFYLPASYYNNKPVIFLGLIKTKFLRRHLLLFLKNIASCPSSAKEQLM
jgi:hypothetical protein